ncbi:MAG: helix-turn-helix domain-containing protein [Planctomycetota bacterium]|nr:MAG: helix-turn-helix domain-containing protein [Planctomycetota bacterium]
MAQDSYTLEELARRLGRDQREIERLAQRGRIPGRKVGGRWQFNVNEITHWLEQEMRELSASELGELERRIESTDAGIDQEVPVSSLLREETVQVPLLAKTKRSVLEGLIEVAGRTWQIWSPADVLRAVLQREEMMSTAFANGVAIPHPRNPLPEAYGESIIAFGNTIQGIPFGAPRRGLTDLFFLVLCRDTATHLKVLARLGRLIQKPGFLETLRECQTSSEAYRVICEADEELSSEA